MVKFHQIPTSGVGVAYTRISDAHTDSRDQKGQNQRPVNVNHVRMTQLTLNVVKFEHTVNKLKIHLHISTLSFWVRLCWSMSTEINIKVSINEFFRKDKKQVNE